MAVLEVMMVTERWYGGDACGDGGAVEGAAVAARNIGAKAASVTGSGDSILQL